MRKKQLHLFFFCCKIWKILTRINSIFCNLNEASKTNPVFYNFCSFCIRFWSCFEVVTNWRWLFHQRVVGKKYGFSTPRSEYGSYDQTVGNEKSPNKYLQVPNVGLHVWWTPASTLCQWREEISQPIILDSKGEFWSKIKDFQSNFSFVSCIMGWEISSGVMIGWHRM